jgi:hypothetical protein
MVDKKVTEAVVIANRENGANAKGPTSKRGKQRSRMNALVHALYSRELKISEADEPELTRCAAAWPVSSGPIRRCSGSHSTRSSQRRGVANWRSESKCNPC